MSDIPNYNKLNNGQKKFLSITIYNSKEGIRKLAEYFNSRVSGQACRDNPDNATYYNIIKTLRLLEW